MSKTINQIVLENINDDNTAKLKTLSEQGFTAQIFTKANLEHAARTGKVKTTTMMANSLYPTMTHDAKVDAMFAAAQAHQVETVKALAAAGVSYTYALGSLTDHHNDRAIIQAVVATGYHPTAEDLNFFKAAGKDAVIEAIATRDHNDQQLYKEAFQRFITDAVATDGMGEQKAMLKAAATGTAADIDYHIANKAAAENSHWLKNLDVALHFGNDSTAQALIKHGATIKPEYVQVAEKYTNEATVEAVRTAQVKQIQEQATKESDAPKKRAKTAKKSQGLSL